MKNGMLVLLALFPLLFVAQGCSKFRGYYVVKSAYLQCRHNSQTNTSLLQADRYHVFPEKQIVVSDMLTYKFKECSIFDEDNWSCKYNDGSGEVRFVDGERSPRYADIFDEKVFIVWLSKWEHLYYYWTRDLWGNFDYSDFCREEEKIWNEVRRMIKPLEDALGKP